MTSNDGFNADQRAEQREKREIVTGSRKFRSRRRIPKVMKGFRKLIRKDEDIARQMRKLNPREALEDKYNKAEQRIEETDDPGTRQALQLELDSLTKQLDELAEMTDDQADELDELEEQRQDLQYDLVAALIQDREDRKAEDAGTAAPLTDEDLGAASAEIAEHLRAHMDVEEVADITTWLLPSRQDPTPTATSSEPSTG